MEMKVQKTGRSQQTGGAFVLLGGVFLLGVLAGSLCCAQVSGVGQLFTSAGQADGFWPRFWPDGALLGLLFLSAWLRAGCPLALLAVGAKGFLAAAQATGLVLALDGAGYGAAAAQLLLPGFLSLAAILLLGRQAMAWSVQRQRVPGGKKPRPDSAFFLTAAICLGLAALAAAAACWLSPKLWQAVQTFLPIE